MLSHLQEGDAVETEVLKPESITASVNETNGDELLKSRYTNVRQSSPKKIYYIDVQKCLQNEAFYLTYLRLLFLLRL